MARMYRQAAREIPVHDEVDVLICGGGPAGFFAAVAAARAGARTLLVEQTNCLGHLRAAGAIVTEDDIARANEGRDID